MKMCYDCNPTNIEIVFQVKFASPNLSILKILMSNDKHNKVMSHLFLKIVAIYVRYVSIQILLKFQPFISYNG